MKSNNFETLSDLATEGGPIYYRFQLALKNWKEEYKKRNNPGDINAIKFINHFAELNNSVAELDKEVKDE